MTHNITQTILRNIQNGSIKQRPKWHFIAIGVLFLSLTAIVALSFFYLISFTLYIIRTHALWEFFDFGPNGYLAFLISLPWASGLLTLTSGIVLGVLLRRYTFGYRKPILISLATLFLGIGVMVLLVAKIDYKQQLNTKAQSHRIPLLYRVYNYYRYRKPTHLHYITVLESQYSDRFTALTDANVTATIYINKDTKILEGTSIAPNSRLLIFGDHITATEIESYGIKDPNLVPIFNTPRK